MAKITNMVHTILARIAEHGADRADRTEAKTLLDRLNDAQPRFAVAKPKKNKKGNRT